MTDSPQYVVVPADLTQEMTNASYGHATRQLMWGAMLAASPTASVDVMALVGALAKWAEIGDWIAADDHDAIDPTLKDRFSQAREVTSTILASLPPELRREKS